MIIPVFFQEKLEKLFVIVFSIILYPEHQDNGSEHFLIKNVHKKMKIKNM